MLRIVGKAGQRRPGIPFGPERLTVRVPTRRADELVFRSRLAPRDSTITSRGTSRSILADGIGKASIASFRSDARSVRRDSELARGRWAGRGADRWHRRRRSSAAPRALQTQQRGLLPRVGFYRPHTPYVAPERYFDMYPRDRIALPALSDADRSRTPQAAYRIASAFPEQDTMTDQRRQEAIQAYWASTTFMDAQVGHVLDGLDRLGLSDNTIVVFTSDHGYHLGDHGLWQKNDPVRTVRARSAVHRAAAGHGSRRRSARPRRARGSLSNAGRSGRPKPPPLDGVSLVPMLTNPAATVKYRR